MGNGQYVNILYQTQVIIDIHRHRSEMHGLISDKHENYSSLYCL